MLPRVVSLTLCLLLGVSENGELGKPGRVMGAPQCHWDTDDVVGEQLNHTGPLQKREVTTQSSIKRGKKANCIVKHLKAS